MIEWEALNESDMDLWVNCLETIAYENNDDEDLDITKDIPRWSELYNEQISSLFQYRKLRIPRGFKYEAPIIIYVLENGFFKVFKIYSHRFLIDKDITKIYRTDGAFAFYPKLNSGYMIFGDSNLYKTTLNELRGMI